MSIYRAFSSWVVADGVAFQGLDMKNGHREHELPRTFEPIRVAFLRASSKFSQVKAITSCFSLFQVKGGQIVNPAHRWIEGEQRRGPFPFCVYGYPFCGLTPICLGDSLYCFSPSFMGNCRSQYVSPATQADRVQRFCLIMPPILTCLISQTHRFCVKST